MRDYYTVRRIISVAAMSLFLILSACDTGGSGSSGTSTDSAPGTAPAPTGDRGAETASTNVTQRGVDAETLPYAEVDEELAYGHFSFPSDMIEPLPAILMIHEWWGLDDNVRATANRLAAEGYIVLAVDLYRGKTASTPIEARPLMLDVVENPGYAEENIRQALNFLKDVAGAPKVATVGWGFGGGLSLNTAITFAADIDACVFYYGQVTNDHDKLRLIDDPLLGLFAADDTGVKVASVNEFQDALRRIRIDHEIHIYPGAGSAFANPTSRHYDADLADDAWQHTLDFLAKNLAVAE